MEKIRVGIIGAGGYGGCGAVELLSRHPQAEITALIDKQDVGKPISDLYPHLKGFCDLPLMDPGDPDCADDLHVVFFATPDGVGQKEAGLWLKKGVKVIDYNRIHYLRCKDGGLRRRKEAVAHIPLPCPL